MKPGKGKDRTEQSDTFVANFLDLPARKRGLSINGEIVPERDLDMVNIHDFAIFEKEQELIPEFRVSIKSRSSASSDGCSPIVDSIGAEGKKGFPLVSATPAAEDHKVTRTPSFKLIAHQVRMVEKVLLRWPCRPRSRHHSSSSEDYFEDEAETNTNREVATTGRNVSEPDVLSVDTAVSQLSAQTDHCDIANDHSPPSKADEVEDSQQDHSQNAQSTIDINLNEDKVSVMPNTNSQESASSKLLDRNETDNQATPASKTAVSESSKVVETSQVQLIPSTKSECCDHGAVVHDAGSPTEPQAAQGKASSGGKEGERRRWCPCVISWLPSPRTPSPLLLLSFGLVSFVCTFLFVSADTAGCTVLHLGGTEGSRP